MRRGLRACVRTKRGRSYLIEMVCLVVCGVVAFVEYVHTLYSLEQSHHVFSDECVHSCEGSSIIYRVNNLHRRDTGGGGGGGREAGAWTDTAYMPGQAGCPVH